MHVDTVYVEAYYQSAAHWCTRTTAQTAASRQQEEQQSEAAKHPSAPRQARALSAVLSQAVAKITAAEVEVVSDVEESRAGGVAKKIPASIVQLQSDKLESKRRAKGHCASILANSLFLNNSRICNRP